MEPCQHITAKLQDMAEDQVRIVAGDCCAYGGAEVVCDQCKVKVAVERDSLDLRHYGYDDAAQEN